MNLYSSEVLISCFDNLQTLMETSLNRGKKEKLKSKKTEKSKRKDPALDWFNTFGAQREKGKRKDPARDWFNTFGVHAVFY